jgi:hypothetical protein
MDEQLAKELKHVQVCVQGSSSHWAHCGTDLQCVQTLICEAEWARDAPATKRLRDRIQNLVNTERALGKLSIPMVRMIRRLRLLYCPLSGY